MTCSRLSLAAAALFSAVLLFCSSPVMANDTPDAATVSGKYSQLIQIMHCPADSGRYGNFKDYGWWGGGPWCGQQGVAGYWVWVAPNWYVWKNKGAPPPPSAPPQAAVSGKYSQLIQVMHCPADSGRYGNFKDYGWWGGGPWCGQQGVAGYWVWVAPNWYVWKNKGAPPSPSAPPQAAVSGKYSQLIQVMHCPADSGRYGNFKDYGWWGGGPWCGQQGVAGYWVWMAPNWYVWKNKQ